MSVAHVCPQCGQRMTCGGELRADGRDSDIIGISWRCGCGFQDPEYTEDVSWMSDDAVEDAIIIGDARHRSIQELRDERGSCRLYRMPYGEAEFVPAGNCPSKPLIDHVVRAMYDAGAWHEGDVIAVRMDGMAGRVGTIGQYGAVDWHFALITELRCRGVRP